MKRFVITGPSGWIGRALLARLSDDLGEAFGERVLAFGSFARNLALPDGRELAVRGLEDLRAEDMEGAHCVHLAYLTREKVDSLGEREFTAKNIAIDDAVLQAIGEGRPSSVFVASSGAAGLAITTPELNPYGLCKLRQEQRFLALGRDLKVPTLVGRVFNIAGPHINKHQSYAVSNMSLQALQGSTIRIAARQMVYRSYLHVDDLTQLIVAAARSGYSSEAPIDLCGPEVVEMGDIASIIARQVGREVSIERPAIKHSVSAKYLGDPTHTKSVANFLGLRLQSLEAQIADTLAWLRSEGGSSQLFDSPDGFGDLVTEKRSVEAY